MRRAVLALAVLLLLSSRASPSWREFAFRGYIRNMASLSKAGSGLNGAETGWEFDDVIHARKNLRWYPTDAISGAVEVKTRLFCGESMKRTLEFTEALAGQPGYFDWSWTMIDEEDLALVTAVDRAWLDYTYGSVQVTVGRQRIAWGTNWVWSPIDIFNPVSPLDFDNEEQPGTDGGRIQYYTGPSSKIEVGIAPNRESERRVAAALVKLNRWAYDLHFVAGRRGRSTVGGGGWAGQFRGGGFRGEWLYSHPDDDSRITEPCVVAALSGDYTFPNSFYVHCEVLYNDRGTTGPAGGIHLLQAMESGDLTPARSSLFGEAAYNFSPLLRANLSGIVNPNDGSYYIGPTAIWSLMTNVDLSAMGLLFGGGDGTEFGDIGEIVFVRLKWSF